MSKQQPGEAARVMINEAVRQGLRGRDATAVIIALALLDVAEAIRDLAAHR